MMVNIFGNNIEIEKFKENQYKNSQENNQNFKDKEDLDNKIIDLMIDFIKTNAEHFDNNINNTIKKLTIKNTDPDISLINSIKYILFNDSILKNFLNGIKIIL